MPTETIDRIEELERAVAAKDRELKILRFDPVCHKCGDPLTTQELICDACRVDHPKCDCEVAGFTVSHKPGCPFYE